MKSRIQLILAVLIVTSLCGCKTVEQQVKARSDETITTSEDYSTRNQANEIWSTDDHLEILAISGGGHRAAHYTLGMFLALDQIPIKSNGSDYKTMLDEIDVVSSVSGGSYGTATYLAAYVEANCVDPNNKLNALELLKRNPRRLKVLASAWVDDLLWGLMPKYWQNEYRNIDQLIDSFHSELLRINGCESISKLLVEHVTKELEEPDPSLPAPPFVHIVNATNAVTGQVFSFYNHGLSKSSFRKIKCYQTDGNFKEGNGGSVPYEIAIASSAAFPPIVTDSIFSVGDDCANGAGPFLRLTDGGQADDNGIDSALHYARRVLKEDLYGVERVLLMSIDSLVETGESYNAKPKDDNFFDVMLERNADLPRYHKKRNQKREIAECDQASPVSLESYSADKSLFAVSVGFARNDYDESISQSISDHSCETEIANRKGGLLAFADKDNSSHQSDISTFSNAGGLNFEQRISGVAEGYYQTVHKLLEIDESKLKSQALSIAFNLYCFKKGKLRQREAEKCFSFYDDNKEYLNICFYDEVQPRSIILLNNAFCNGGRRTDISFKNQIAVFNDV